jgi:tetratricopeptide (TPR) repeat protein
LPPAPLIPRAGALVAAGRVAEGKRLLEIVATRAPGNMSANEQYALNVALGDLYRSEQNWHNAAQAYRSALSAGPRTEDLLYLLGMSLREAGLNEEALTVLGEGLLILQTDRPYFVSSFYIQLGLTQASLGYNSEAILSLQKAKEWELREFSPNPDQLDFIGRQIVEVGSQ